MTQFQYITVLVAAGTISLTVISLTAIVVYSYTKMLKAQQHMHKCQRLMLRAISRLNMRYNKLERALHDHVLKHTHMRKGDIDV